MDIFSTFSTLKGDIDDFTSKVADAAKSVGIDPANPFRIPGPTATQVDAPAPTAAELDTFAAPNGGNLVDRLAEMTGLPPVALKGGFLVLVGFILWRMFGKKKK